MCWIVKSTLCGSQLQGDFYSKLGNCMKCDFLKEVYREEGRDFSYGMKLLYDKVGKG